MLVVIKKVYGHVKPLLLQQCSSIEVPQNVVGFRESFSFFRGNDFLLQYVDASL